MTQISLGYSTCPNDTFIFGGLASGAVTAPGIDFQITLADVEELNGWTRDGGPDVCKVSVAAVASITDDYWLLRSGGAMGYGVGPLLVAAAPRELSTLGGSVIAVPGQMTTATLLLRLMLREAEVEARFESMIFDAVMDAVVDRKADAGVIIHEGRFTYADRGLVKLADLGAWWEESRGLPIPLGCIAIKRSLGEAVAQSVNRAIRESLAWAQEDETRVWAYVKGLAKEMANDVVREHIRTFVTAYSHDVGRDGEQAVAAIVSEACAVLGRAMPDQSLFFKESSRQAAAS